ncbi:hypothetical protein SI65_08802 [Aspergillus cristatus]|uniref:Uncharacterized protein n=1 Tax=Aspergillus cristatus TaxID=573508 RepID=A0A1E3B585_ASPCR|nr:hypothetical protein SI65_08802 [Aspergillus cristatus]
MSLDGLNDSAGFVDDPSTQLYDERKLRVPYVKGSRFTAQQDISPPIKLNPSMGCTFEYYDDAETMKALHPIERCIQYPPLNGSYGSLSLELQVQETIRIGDCHHAQVVVVEVLTASCPLAERLSKGQCVVAKLYDPMYIDDDNFYINPFLVANKDYTNETAAYKALYDFQGSKIPQYYMHDRVLWEDKR